MVPELGCFEVRWRQTDYRGQNSTGEVLWIKRGDPAESLFEIPAHYTERSPSQALAEAARREGKPCSDCGLSTTAQRDASYFSRQRPFPK